MDDILRFPSAVKHDPAIDTWLRAQRDDLRPLVETWFACMRQCGADVHELMHDGCPTACVDDAAFGYVNAFKAHVNVGFFFGALLKDPARLLEGTGKRGRHVKLRPGRDVDSAALAELVRAAYVDIQARLRQHPNASRGNVMQEKEVAAPDNTAVRVALWRALHVEIDPPPHVFEDDIGLKLAAPEDGWRSRPDMSPFTRPFRASIVARARFIEDLVTEQAARGVGQYVILGAGLDTFAQRRPDLASRLSVFEIDRPGAQAWKRQRLVDLGFGVPSFLRLVPVDFEAGDAWWERLAASGFDSARPAVVASTGVSMYLTKAAIATTLRQVAAFGPGSTLAMSFMLPIELTDPDVRPGIERAAEGARANGTPFISFFTPTEMLTLARDCGFRDVQHVSAATLAQRYFAGRTDGLRPPNNSEELLVATT
jgi:methyltransferase (TIGR00027 family)